MDNETYLIKRGWKESRTKIPFVWLDPIDNISHNLRVAIAIQTARDAEQLDNMLANVKSLEQAAAIIDALISLDLSAEKILAAIKSDLDRGLDGSGHLGVVDLLIQARIEATQAAYDDVLGGQADASKV